MKPTDFAYHLTGFLTKHLPWTVGASQNTIRAYRDTFSLLLRFCQHTRGMAIERIVLADLDKILVEDFLNWLVTARRCCESTRNQRLAAIHSFCRYMQLQDPVRLHFYQQILAIPAKKAKVTSVNYLSLEGMQAILDAPDTEKHGGRRDAVLLSLLYDLGARVQELADLTVGDVRLSEPATVRLTGKGNRSRIVPLMKPSTELVKQYLAENHLNDFSKRAHPLFSNRSNDKLTRFGIEYILKKYVTAVRNSSPGLLPDSVSPHTIRHSKAMHLHQAGVDIVYIRDLLGHSSIRTTEIYARTDSLMKRRALEAVIDKTAKPASLPSWQQDGDLLAWLKNLG